MSRIAVSPRLELFFAFATALDGSSQARDDGARHWLNQARRRLDRSFRRRLGDFADPEAWRRLAALPLPREAALSADADGVIEAVDNIQLEAFAFEPEARQRLVVDALRRFDRLAFASYWRSWREELTAAADRFETRLDAEALSGLFLPSRFAPPDFTTRIPDDGTILRVFDPDRLSASTPVAAATVPALPRKAPAGIDPALIFRALGDATRYTIAGMIAREPLTSADLARRLGVSKPTMAHHLRALRTAGLVGERVQGTRIVLTLERSALESLSGAAVAQLFGAATGAPIRRSRRG